MDLPLILQDIAIHSNIESKLLFVAVVVVVVVGGGSCYKQLNNKLIFSRCMKILKDEFMTDLRAKYGTEQVDQAVTMD